MDLKVLTPAQPEAEVPALDNPTTTAEALSQSIEGPVTLATPRLTHLQLEAQEKELVHKAEHDLRL